MKKTVFLFLIVGFIALLGCSKKKLDYSEKAIDSIPIYLVLANEDSVPYPKRMVYTKRVYDVFISQINDSINRLNLFKIANRYYNMGNMEEYQKTTRIILGKAIEQNDSLDMAKAYSYLGDYFSDAAINKDSAYFYYTKAKKIYQKKNDKIKLGSAYVSMATAQAYEHDFLGSELSAIKALEVLRGTPEKSKVYEAYNVLGFVANEFKDYGKALEYHFKALAVAKENNLVNFNEVPSSLNNIGNVYENQKKYKLAIEFYEEALKHKNVMIYKPSLHGILLDNLAYSKFKLKDYSQLPDLFYKSLRIRDSLNIGMGIINNKIHLSEYYSEQGDIARAKKNAIEALNLSRKIKKNIAILMSLNQLSVVDSVKASVYREEYVKLNDSLHFEERKRRDKFARIRYEADEMIVEKDKAVLQKWTMFWIAVSVLLSGLIFYIFRIRTTKQRELLLMLSRQKADEEIYHLISEQQQKFEEGREKEKRRIAGELHDGVLGKLSGIRTNLLVLQDKTDSETVRYCISQIGEIQNVEKEVRGIAHDLDRDCFSPKGGYQGLLESAIKEFTNKTSLKIDFEIDKTIDWSVLDNQKKLGVYQIFQDCLNAINRQEIGTDVTVRFNKNNSLLIMEVGGTLTDIKNHEKEQILKGVGLRAKEIGADLRISNILDGKISLRMTMLIKTDQNF